MRVRVSRWREVEPCSRNRRLGSQPPFCPTLVLVQQFSGGSRPSKSNGDGVRSNQDPSKIEEAMIAGRADRAVARASFCMLLSTVDSLAYLRFGPIVICRLPHLKRADTHPAADAERRERTLQCQRPGSLEGIEPTILDSASPATG